MTLGVFLAHVAARWAVTRTPACGWVPDESEIEMTEKKNAPTTLELGNTAQIVLRQLAEHRRARPFDPDLVDSPPAYEVARMDEWQRMDSALHLVLGVHLANLALSQWQEAMP